MKKFLCSLAAGFIVLTTNANALPIELTYGVSAAGGGTYQYNFALTLTNADGTWSAGQGWDFIIFGDHISSPPTVLPNWVGIRVDLPYTGFYSTYGSHNGPTLLQSPGFVPIAVGDALTWSGTSTALVTRGLLWSVLIQAGGASLVSFAPATMTGTTTTAGNNTVPEPAPLALLGFGLLGLGFARKRRRG